jgi:hypothetical protein
VLANTISQALTYAHIIPGPTVNQEVARARSVRPLVNRYKQMQLGSPYEAGDIQAHESALRALAEAGEWELAERGLRSLEAFRGRRSEPATWFNNLYGLSRTYADRLRIDSVFKLLEYVESRAELDLAYRCRKRSGVAAELTRAGAPDAALRVLVPCREPLFDEGGDRGAVALEASIRGDTTRPIEPLVRSLPPRVREEVLGEVAVSLARDSLFDQAVALVNVMGDSQHRAAAASKLVADLVAAGRGEDARTLVRFVSDGQRSSQATCELSVWEARRRRFRSALQLARGCSNPAGQLVSLSSILLIHASVNDELIR